MFEGELKKQLKGMERMLKNTMENRQGFSSEFQAKLAELIEKVGSVNAELDTELRTLLESERLEADASSDDNHLGQVDNFPNTRKLNLNQLIQV